MSDDDTVDGQGDLSDEDGQEELLNHAVLAQHAAEQQQLIAIHHQSLPLDQAQQLHELHMYHSNHFAQVNGHTIDPTTGLSTPGVVVLHHHPDQQLQLQQFQQLQLQQQLQHAEQVHQVHHQAHQVHHQAHQVHQAQHVVPVNTSAAQPNVEEHLAQSNSHLAPPEQPHVHPQQISHAHLDSSGSCTPKAKRVQTRRSWTPEEDKRLLELVKTDGTNCWSQIATHLEGRVGKQCRERWRNHLDPNIRRECFTPEEDEHILELVQDLGTRWSKIAQRLPGRTENAVKNRYHCFLKNRDANNGKRARDEKGALVGLKNKRPNDKSFMMFESEFAGKGSPEGSFACNLLGCGKTFSQLSHLLAHRLTHFVEGRHPSIQAQQLIIPAVPGLAEDPHQQQHQHHQQHQQHHQHHQHPQQQQAETVMLVRALDGLVDDLLSHVHHPQRDPHDDSIEEHKVLVGNPQHVGVVDPSLAHHHIKVDHNPQVLVSGGLVSTGLVAHHPQVVLHPQYMQQVEMAQHVEQYVVADAAPDT